MATQIVPVMRVRVDPNPRGSATSHVTMPAANPFEREELSVRSANKPTEMLPGMGYVPQEMLPGMGDDISFGAASKDTAFDTFGEKSTDNGFSWGEFGQGLTESILDIGEAFAINEIKGRQMENLQEAQGTQDIQEQLIRTMGRRRPTQQMPAVNPNQVYVPPPRRGLGTGTTVALVAGGVAVVGLLGFMMMQGGGRRRRRR